MSTPLVNALLPIQVYLDDEKVNEIMVNRPNQIIIEMPNKKEIKKVNYFNLSELKELAGLIGTFNNQRVNKNEPLLSGTLPGGQRVQIVLPPAVPSGMFGLSIRKPTNLDLSLDDYENSGALCNLKSSSIKSLKCTNKRLNKHLLDNNIVSFLRLCIKTKKNIIVSGGTSSGKTTFMNALIKLIDINERIITIQDVQEMIMKQNDVLHLLHSKGMQGVSNVTVKNLLEASLRLNPDRILVSEIRGEEAFFYLRAINSGHPGSLTSLHANDIKGAFIALKMMIKQGTHNLDDVSIDTFLKSVVDVVVQFEKIDGKRVMTDLYFKDEIK